MAFLTATTFSPPSPARLLGLAAAVLVAEAFWVGAKLVSGVPLQAPAGTISPQPVDIGPLPIALASSALSLLGWAVLAALERLTTSARCIWLTLALTVLAATLVGPLIGTGVSITNRLVLVLMHLADAGILMTVLYRTSPGRGAHLPPPGRRAHLPQLPPGPGGAARLPSMARHSHAAHRPPVHTDPAQSRPPLTFGTLYPQDDIVAVIDDLRQAKRAEAALHAAGIPDEDSDVLDAALVIQAMHAIDRRRGWLGRLAAGVGSLVSEDADHMRTYREEAERGHALVVVHAGLPGVVEQVARVLSTHGAHGMRHYGRFVVTELY